MYNYYKISDTDDVRYVKLLDNGICSKPIILSSSINEYEHLILKEMYDLEKISDIPDEKVIEISEIVFETKFNGIIGLATIMADPKVIPHYFVRGTNKDGQEVISKIISVTTNQGSKMIAKGLSITNDGTLMIIHMNGSFDEESCKAMLNGIPDEDLQEYPKINEEDFITQFNEWIELTKKFIK